MLKSFGYALPDIRVETPYHGRTPICVSVVASGRRWTPAGLVAGQVGLVLPGAARLVGHRTLPGPALTYNSNGGDIFTFFPLSAFLSSVSFLLLTYCV